MCASDSSLILLSFLLSLVVKFDIFSLEWRVKDHYLCLMEQPRVRSTYCIDQVQLIILFEPKILADGFGYAHNFPLYM